MQLLDKIKDCDSGQHKDRQGCGEDGRMACRPFPTAFRTLNQATIDEPFRRFLRDHDALRERRQGLIEFAARSDSRQPPESYAHSPTPNAWRDRSAVRR
jgi:hypothetical protein